MRRGISGSLTAKIANQKGSEGEERKGRKKKTKKENFVLCSTLASSSRCFAVIRMTPDAFEFRLRPPPRLEDGGEAGTAGGDLGVSKRLGLSPKTRRAPPAIPYAKICIYVEVGGLFHLEVRGKGTARAGATRSSRRAGRCLSGSTTTSTRRYASLKSK